jgi:selenocysteine lyase/cysteine desulfurase
MVSNSKIELTLDLSPLRAQFPALHETDAQGKPYVYFDRPGSTQVPQGVLDAMTHYLIRANANKGDQFITSLLAALREL